MPDSIPGLQSREYIQTSRWM